MKMVVLSVTIFATFGLIGQVAQADTHSPRCSDLLYVNLPVVAQTTDFTCGVACFDSLLQYWKGQSPGEWMLGYNMGTFVRRQTDPGAIVQAARQYGLYSQEQFGMTIFDLRRFLAAGETVYVGWRSGGAGHYSLVRGIGFDHITLMDPGYARENPGQYNKLSFQDFLPFWNDGVSWRGQVIRVSSRPLLP